MKVFISIHFLMLACPNVFGFSTRFGMFDLGRNPSQAHKNLIKRGAAYRSSPIHMPPYRYGSNDVSQRNNPINAVPENRFDSTSYEKTSPSKSPSMFSSTNNNVSTIASSMNVSSSTHNITIVQPLAKDEMTNTSTSSSDVKQSKGVVHSSPVSAVIDLHEKMIQWMSVKKMEEKEKLSSFTYTTLFDFDSKNRDETLKKWERIGAGKHETTTYENVDRGAVLPVNSPASSLWADKNHESNTTVLFTGTLNRADRSDGLSSSSSTTSALSAMTTCGLQTKLFSEPLDLSRFDGIYVECLGDANTLLTRWDLCITMRKDSSASSSSDLNKQSKPSHINEDISTSTQTELEQRHSSSFQMFTHLIQIPTPSSSSPSSVVHRTAKSLFDAPLKSTKRQQSSHLKKVLLPFKDMKSALKINMDEDVMKHLPNIVQISLRCIKPNSVSTSDLGPKRTTLDFHFEIASLGVYSKKTSQKASSSGTPSSIHQGAGGVGGKGAAFDVKKSLFQLESMRKSTHSLMDRMFKQGQHSFKSSSEKEEDIGMSPKSHEESSQQQHLKKGNTTPLSKRVDEFTRLSSKNSMFDTIKKRESRAATFTPNSIGVRNNANSLQVMKKLVGSFMKLALLPLLLWKLNGAILSEIISLVHKTR